MKVYLVSLVALLMIVGCMRTNYDKFVGMTIDELQAQSKLDVEVVYYADWVPDCRTFTGAVALDAPTTDFLIPGIDPQTVYGVVNGQVVKKVSLAKISRGSNGPEIEVTKLQQPLCEFNRGVYFHVASEKANASKTLELLQESPARNLSPEAKSKFEGCIYVPTDDLELVYCYFKSGKVEYVLTKKIDDPFN